MRTLLLMLALSPVLLNAQTTEDEYKTVERLWPIYIWYPANREAYACWSITTRDYLAWPIEQQKQIRHTAWTQKELDMCDDACHIGGS